MDPAEYAVQREYSWRHMKGMDATKFVRMWEKQSGTCAICGQPLVCGNRQVFVDHCHKTLKPRGLLCNACNSGIGFFNDNANRLRSAAKYIEESECA